MTPYASLLYFTILAAVTVPTLIPGLAARLHLSRGWILLATAIIVVVQYRTLQTLWPGGAAVREVWLVLGFGVLQYGVALGLLAIRRRGRSRPAFYLALALGLAPMLMVKVLPITVPSVAVGFLGLSYVTFRSLDVILGIQDGLIKALPPSQYLAYLLFFPTISAGPIDRYRRFARDWDHNRTRAEFISDLDGMVQHIFRGLFYKYILAALIQRYWLGPMTDGVQVTHVVAYMYGYAFFLFFDFAGYSAFAIGFSYLLGVHTPENFNRPFISRNIREFWDRWHITLSTWFRDQVYMRFVFAATKGKWFRSRYTASYLGFILTMVLMGLWHGFAWHYLIYGLYHGCLLAGHDWFTRWNKQHQLVANTRFSHAASIFVTFNLVCIGLLIFSGRLWTA